ncbi:Protein of unknwon function [Anaerovibrio lipolyticus DSM 3074]|uniref:Protein of unknwon function n=1 Tax=Anaerovibrio lipolyticus DSM 3074 TaxID=1120997 RepID=A0A1M6DZP6_9FIRM|nr:DUF3310 domain-containing protein [Anaerovibrio lipolyticus]SHI78706.1 Protein of unknwon function [Anaerovibrio lipolyticus DSM 3074]
MIKIDKREGRKVYKCDSGGKILKVYDSLQDVAKDLDVSMQTAYYRVKSSRSGRTASGLLLLYEDDWEAKFPVLAEKRYGDEVDNELELLNKPITAVKENKKAVDKAKAKEDKKLEPMEKQPASEQADKQTSKLQQLIDEQARADERERMELEAVSVDPVNHPSHYCTGDIECWDAMMSAFGPEWMMAYANVAAFKYAWRAKHKGRFAEDMKKAAWYNMKAAELAERMEAKA